MLVIQHVYKASEGQSREFQLEMRDELRWEMWAEKQGLENFQPEMTRETEAW